MNRPSEKWHRATMTKTKRKKSSSWVSHGQLYREISAGYEYYLAARIRTATLQHESR